MEKRDVDIVLSRALTTQRYRVYSLLGSRKRTILSQKFKHSQMRFTVIAIVLRFMSSLSGKSFIEEPFIVYFLVTTVGFLMLKLLTNYCMYCILVCSSLTKRSRR